jgi:hypothetical protein
MALAQSNSLFDCFGLTAYADDFACLIQGLLDLYEAGGHHKWLEWGIELQQSMDELFWDSAGGEAEEDNKETPASVGNSSGMKVVIGNMSGCERNLKCLCTSCLSICVDDTLLFLNQL